MGPLMHFFCHCSGQSSDAFQSKDDAIHASLQAGYFDAGDCADWALPVQQLHAHAFWQRFGKRGLMIALHMHDSALLQLLICGSYGQLT
jgi:hypothetical protein